MAFGNVGIEGNRITASSDGIVELPSVSKGIAEIVVDFGKVGIERDGLPKSGNGLIRLSPILKDKTKIAVGLGVVRPNAIAWR